MALLSKGESKGSDFEPVPAGTHLARCVSVVDMGLQETRFGRKDKVYLGFEVPGVRVKWKKDDQEHEGPALIGSTYTNSIHPKSILGQHLEAWRGKAFTDEERQGFDLFTLLNVPCMISVTHNTSGDKVYANINGIMKPMAGTEVPPAETPVIGYTPGDAEKIGNLDKLPNWLQEKCKAGHGAAADSLGAAQHVSGMMTDVAGGQNVDGPPTPPPAFDDDIPF